MLYRTTLMLNVSVPNCFHNDIQRNVGLCRAGRGDITKIDRILQPNDSAGRGPCSFATVSLPLRNTVCEPGSLSGATIRSQLIVLSVLTTLTFALNLFTERFESRPLRCQHIGHVNDDLAVEVRCAGRSQRRQGACALRAVEDEPPKADVSAKVPTMPLAPAVLAHVRAPACRRWV